MLCIFVHSMQTIFERLGEANLTLLVHNFYDLVFADPQISRLFKTDKELIKEKQRLFLTQFFGGPQLYSRQYGHPQLRARHLPHPIGDDDAVAWLSCMSRALASLPVEESLKDEIFKKLVPTAMFMVNRSDGNE